MNETYCASDLRAMKRRLGVTWDSLATAVGVAPNTMRRWGRGVLAIGNPDMLRLALERVETEGLAADPVSNRTLYAALRQSKYLAKNQRATPRLKAARAVLHQALRTEKKLRDHRAVRLALQEHGAAFAENRALNAEKNQRGADREEGES